MEYYDLIRARESIRDYDPARPLSPEVLERILDAGRVAPSACNNQPWEFLVIRSPEMLERARECYHRPWFKDAPNILIVLGLKDKAWVRGFDGYNSIETDLAIVLTHLILAAENEGVGTCWIEAYDPAILRKVLDLDDNRVVFGITPLGYPRPGFVKKGNKNRKTLDEIVKYL
ncbi:MAG TPA: nitroreductase family protein [Bacteroidales bacterium]|nr:nitroreductase family protein [Bacteroidales bacterium]